MSLPANDLKVVVSFHVFMLMMKFSWLLTTRPS
jgi:hypothetical protein